ncbi:MAG: hypothetical protein IJ728_09675 [Selenomonadaceae bacterium]|nr:hypothetical protein [Selenomonadaceae bacterium]
MFSDRATSFNENDFMINFQHFADQFNFKGIAAVYMPLNDYISTGVITNGGVAELSILLADIIQNIAEKNNTTENVVLKVLIKTMELKKELEG